MAPDKNEGTLPKQINEELLLCKICLGSFDLESKCPRMLDCSHTFCESCIVNYLMDGRSKGSRKLVCPLCSEKTRCGSDGVTSLSENETIVNLIGMMRRQAEKEAMKQQQQQNDGEATNFPRTPTQISPEGNIWLSRSPRSANQQGQRKLKGILKTKTTGQHVEKNDCLIVKSVNKALHPPPRGFADDSDDENETSVESYGKRSQHTENDEDETNGCYTNDAENTQPAGENQWLGPMVYPIRQLNSMAPNAPPDYLKQKSKNPSEIIPDMRADPFRKCRSDEINCAEYLQQGGASCTPSHPDVHHSQCRNANTNNKVDKYNSEYDLDYNYFNQTPADLTSQMDLNSSMQWQENPELSDWRQDDPIRSNLTVYPDHYQDHSSTTNKPIIRSIGYTVFASEPRKAVATAKFITQFGRYDQVGNDLPGTFNSPTKISCSEEGHLAVLDPLKTINNIQLFTADGNFLSAFPAAAATGVCFLPDDQLGIANYTGVEIYACSDGQQKKTIPIGQVVSIASYRTGFIAAHPTRLTVCPTLTSGFVMHSINEMYQEPGRRSVPFKNILDIGTCKMKENLIVILDSGSIKIIELTGRLITNIQPELTPACGPFASPFAVTLSSAGDWMLVTDAGNKRVLMFNTQDGQFIGSLVNFDASEEGISGVVVNKANQMYLLSRSSSEAEVKIYSIII